MAGAQSVLSEHFKKLEEAIAQLDKDELSFSMKDAVLKIKETRLGRLKNRIADVERAKADAIASFDEKITAFEREAKSLELLIVQDQKRKVVGGKKTKKTPAVTKRPVKKKGNNSPPT